MPARSELDCFDGLKSFEMSQLGFDIQGAPMVAVSSFGGVVAPVDGSSSSDGNSEGTPSGCSIGNSFTGSPDCSLQGEPPVLPASVSLSVDACFSGQTVLITGVTGFVGSVVLEQLLRVCPSVKRVYVIIREKRGLTGTQRIDWLFHKKPLFLMHWKDGKVPQEVQNKVVVIPGDLHKPGLGLSEEDEARIVNEVQFVVHSAASISFFEHIHTLLEQNYEATKKVATLALKIKQLKAFVHVSTAYVNCNLPRGSHIEEQIYPLYHKNGKPVEHKALALRLADMPPAKAEAEAQKLLKEVHLPNSYTLTKHMCEDLLAELHCKQFPVCIVRPTIIGAIANLPVPGYFGNAAGLTSATLAFATGMARFTCHDPHNVYDVIPCDLVASNILVSACALTQPSLDHEKALVVHAATSCTHPANYYNLMRTIVHPYWSADPPDHRLSKKPYKTVDHHTAWVPEDSLVFKAMRLKHGMKFRMMAVGLKMAGHKKVANMITSSWKVWKLYNTKTMDFHLFFCAKTACELQALVVTDEREDVINKGVKMIWEEGKDEWAPYAMAHMEAIRAKYFPKTVKEPKDKKGLVEQALPSEKTVDYLADAAATNAPAGPMKEGTLVGSKTITEKTLESKPSRRSMFAGRKDAQVADVTAADPPVNPSPNGLVTINVAPTVGACC